MDYIMGQYHKPVNITKKEFIHPHKMGDGLKLLEFGLSSNGTMTGLAILLACSNNRGGGDLGSDDSVIGSWAGDQIAIVGDYWEQDEANAKGIPTWDDIEREGYEDISDKVLRAMIQDSYIKSEMLNAAASYGEYEGLFTENEITARKAELDAEKETTQS